MLGYFGGAAGFVVDPAAGAGAAGIAAGFVASTASTLAVMSSGPLAKNTPSPSTRSIALSLCVALDLPDKVALHLADLLVAAGRGIVLEFSGFAGELTLLITERLLSLRTVGLGHHRALLLQFFVPGLQIVLHRQQFAPPRGEFVLERLHRGLGLRSFLEQLLKIDHAHFDFRVGGPRAQQAEQAQGQERNGSFESRHVAL